MSLECVLSTGKQEYLLTLLVTLCEKRSKAEVFFPT